MRGRNCVPLRDSQRLQRKGKQLETIAGLARDPGVLGQGMASFHISRHTSPGHRAHRQCAYLRNNTLQARGKPRARPRRAQARGRLSTASPRQSWGRPPSRGSPGASPRLRGPSPAKASPEQGLAPAHAQGPAPGAPLRSFSNEPTPVMVSDERAVKHLIPTLGSSLIASSAYQKWPT